MRPQKVQEYISTLEKKYSKEPISPSIRASYVYKRSRSHSIQAQRRSLLARHWGRRPHFSLLLFPKAGASQLRDSRIPLYSTYANNRKTAFKRNHWFCHLYGFLWFLHVTNECGHGLFLPSPHRYNERNGRFIGQANASPTVASFHFVHLPVHSILRCNDLRKSKAC